ncbi:ChrR family anti-sigma-E factor [Pseudooceanicola onchidii]|uniref:ChrR family anti-sigma-E factor n=1 Tax=Pseudooceanicola onchidii TaxID=2562279 RepID=UPI0010AA2613|nr:ChrR family anti-sigma-E factor [Pseudooceanicola onchidii]
MTIKHHLTENLLMGYAAGTLPEAFNLVVASHVSMCDTCRAALESYEALGGAVLESRGVDLADDGLAACLARLDDAPVADRPAPVRPVPGALPAPLRDYIGGDIDAIRWRPVGGGVKQAILPTSDAASARLLFIPAGAAVPDHGHRGMELTMVLQGAFADETDHFGRGDVEIADEELEHTPVADIGADCICLAATDAPLRFRSLIPRLLQPFLKI